jgi:HlyD family secretion protein
MKKYKIWILIIAVLLAGGAGWYFGFRKKEKPVTLATERPRYGYISKSVTATGTIEPVDTVSVGCQVSGTIQKIYTDFNDVVRKGQLIAEMDKSLFVAAVNQYKANLGVAKATLVYEKSNYDRQSVLYDSGAISKADDETADDTYLTAKSTVESVQAQLDAANKDLDYASIYSPVDGVVMTRNISVGQTVAASFNTPTLFIIAKDITKMQVQAAVDEADVGDVKVGQRVIFTVDAYPNITFTGMVNQVRLEPVVSANVVTYTTIITAPNEDLKLKPGMTANIFIYTKEDNNSLLISSKALKFKPDAALKKQFIIRPLPPDTAREQVIMPGQNFPVAIGDTSTREIDLTPNGVPATVWLLSGDTLIERRILTGLNDDTHVEILDGLTVNDAVVNGIGQNPATVPGAGTAPVSPFMPTRRPSSPPPKPAAGASGR